MLICEILRSSTPVYKPNMSAESPQVVSPLRLGRENAMSPEISPSMDSENYNYMQSNYEPGQ